MTTAVPPVMRLLVPLEPISDPVIRRALQIALRSPEQPDLKRNMAVIARGLTVAWSEDRSCKEIHLMSYAHRPRTAPADADLSDLDAYTMIAQVFNDAIVMRAPLSKERMHYEPVKGKEAAKNFVPALWQFLLREFRCNFGIYVDSITGQIGLKRERGSRQEQEKDFYEELTEGTEQNTALRVNISTGVWQALSLRDRMLLDPNVLRVLHQAPEDLRDRAKELEAMREARPESVDKQLA